MYFAVIGGGRDGALYVRQLLRAAAAGRPEVDAIRVIDRDPVCAVARSFGDPRLELVASDWSDWLDDGLDALPAGAHLVPYHWAPHLLFDWLRRQAERRGAGAQRGPALPARGLPFEGGTAAGDRALSYAAWECPPMCIEPALCPHTRGPKSWSLASDLESFRAEDPVQDRIVFRALHLAWGVGTIPVADILAGRDLVVAGLEKGRRTYLVATSSHCHALAAALVVTPPRC